MKDEIKNDVLRESIEKLEKMLSEIFLTWQEIKKNAESIYRNTPTDCPRFGHLMGHFGMFAASCYQSYIVDAYEKLGDKYKESGDCKKALECYENSLKFANFHGKNESLAHMHDSKKEERLEGKLKILRFGASKQK